MSKRYPDVPASTTALEEEVLARWKEEGTFQRSLEKTRDREPFVFYEGPPTANGRPGIHHVFSRTIKDTVARFRTMQGRFVPRMAGWDTHGLPVEIEAEKKLGISGKREIEAIGIARFNEVCRESVLQYTEEWERFSARIGYWLDYSRPYVTYHADYIESVWWLVKQIADRGLVYRGHKILPYCPRCGTGLSSHEVAQGYRDVKDPSLYVILPILGEGGEADGRELLVWTTTPWTLVSNTALAVNPGLEYAEVEHEGRRLVLAAARVPALFGAEATVSRTFPAGELVGLRYARPFDWVATADFPADAVARAWHVYPAEWVTAEDGTGIVHTAPAFGADDYALGQEHGLPVLNPVDDRGAFRAEIPLVGGRFVKEADTDLVIALKQRGQVFKSTREEHSYPHCWRCGSPLLYMARDSWFIRTTQVRDDLLANNGQIHWFPPETGSGRFGEWLENNVDWAISRSRYWGTPLPIWVCDASQQHVEVLGSFEELRVRVGALPEPFDPHRPFIDEHAWACGHPGCAGTLRRIPEVIDVWFDSGAMPWAQHHYPFENRATQERQFPADFISEGVDQTRGWFYSLLAISTLLGRGPSYRNVVVNDLILDAEGLKMSKSKGNVVNPWEAVEQFGADAIRWYLLSSANPWVPKRFDPEGVKEVQRKTFDTLRNTYRFFALYANLEGWTQVGGGGDPVERSVLDRWLLSRLATVTREVRADLEGYNLTRAVRLLGDFVTDDLSNWYVRRSRDRFWGTAESADARAAFATLYGALVVVSRLMAPVAPFFSDWLHRALTGESAHLASFPEARESARDVRLERHMVIARGLSTLGRALREEIGIKVRQPLRVAYVYVPKADRPTEELLESVRDELNVKSVEFMDRAEELIGYRAKPKFRELGAMFGRDTPKMAEVIKNLGQDDLKGLWSGASIHYGDYSITRDLVEVVPEAKGELPTKALPGLILALEPTITADLRAEGLARELVSRIQRFRKEIGLEVSDRIRLGVAGGAGVLEALTAHVETVAGRKLALTTLGNFVEGETLAREMEVYEGTLPMDRYAAVREVDLDGVPATIGVSKA